MELIKISEPQPGEKMETGTHDNSQFIEQIELERKKEAVKLNLEIRKNITNRYPH